MEYNNDNYQLLGYDCLLKQGDVVVFVHSNVTFRYEVNTRHLNLLNVVGGQDNSIIFEKLKIEKIKYAEQQYGYNLPNKTGHWPECQQHDFVALTQLVIALFETIKTNETGPVAPQKAFKLVYKDKSGKRQEKVVEENTLDKAKSTITDMDELYYHIEY